MEDSISENDVEFGLEVTKTVIWNLNLDTGNVAVLHGPVKSLFNVDKLEDLETVEDFFENAVHPEDASHIEHIYLKVLRGQSDVFKTEFRTHPKNGDIEWVEIHGRTRTTDGSRILTGTATEITKQKQRERKLERQNERLEEVISTLSHDFRNPLTVAEGHLELVQEEYNSEHLSAVKRAHDRLNALVESLLASVRDGKPLTRGSRTTEELDVVEIATLVEECWRNVETLDATLIVETSQSISVDRQQLAQLLENLIRNAVEHSGSDVTVTIGDLEEESGFYVSDDGPGISETERRSIFERGYSTSDEGVGLGLHIVKKIVDAHNWEIAVTESASGGARFEITEVTS